MFEGAAALFIVLGLAALGRLMAAAFAVFGRFRLFPPGLDRGLDRAFGRFNEPLLAAFGRFAVAKVLPAFGRFAATLLPAFGRFGVALEPALGRFAGFALAIDAPGCWFALFGRAP